jgi:hypothetical protein
MAISLYTPVVTVPAGSTRLRVGREGGHVRERKGPAGRGRGQFTVEAYVPLGVERESSLPRLSSLSDLTANPLILLKWYYFLGAKLWSLFKGLKISMMPSPTGC